MPADEHTLAVYHYEIFADYHLIYLEDSALEIGTSRDEQERTEQINEFFATLITPRAIARHLAVAPGLVCIMTVRPMDVPLVVEIRDAAPPEDAAGWDYIWEASLDVPSGWIVVIGATDSSLSAPRIQVNPGAYRVRVSVGGLATVSADHLDGADHYHAALWPALHRDPAVLHDDGSAW